MLLSVLKIDIIVGNMKKESQCCVMRGVAVALTLCAAVRVMAMTSPDGRTAYEFKFEDGRAKFAVSYDRKPMATVATGTNWRECSASGSVSRHCGGWQTVWGERAMVKDAYVEEHFRAVDANGKTVIVEVRAYDEGFAFRCRLPEGGAFAERTSVDYPSDARAWAIEKTEGTYPERPLAFVAGAAEWMTPLTVESASGFCSFFDAYAVNYPRIRAIPRAGGIEIKLLQKEAPTLAKGAATPWRALQLAADAAQLVDHSTLALNLNPPCALEDTTWIVPGLTLSNLSNCRLENGELLAAVKAERASGVRYLQLDWGWYGTEWGWSDADRARFVEVNPSMREEPTWRGNTTGNARRAVKGIVPYLPGWQRQFAVDLDFPTLIPALKEQGVGLCLYVRGSVLEKENLDDLFALYHDWGVEGIKPGFVRYGSAADTDWNRRVVETAARHRLWVDIHDSDIPDGSQRTYPNLFQVEGVGGEEGKHPVRQDVSIPFARGLVGPFDYTPMAFAAGRSQAHVLAMLLCYYGPTAVLRGSAVTRDRLAGTEWGWSDARRFVKDLPWTYDESRTLDAAIGRRLVTARRSGRRWFAAGLSGATTESVPLDCGFLSSGVRYRLTLWADDLADDSSCRRTVRTERMVTAADSVRVSLAAAGGFVAQFDPVGELHGGETSLSGSDWTCDGVPVSVPHTWNAVDGADGLDVPAQQPGHNSASSKSYWRGAKTYRRSLPDLQTGRRFFIRCDGVSITAEVRVNGRVATRHEGAFTGFTCEVTDLLKPTGNVLEIVADNTYDPEVPPNEGDFTMYGGVYRDVWWIDKPAICVDPQRAVRVLPDVATGRVRAEVPVSGAPDSVQTFVFDAPERWSPENPKLYEITVTAGTDRVTIPFGFRTVEMRADGFYLNGAKRQLRGVCRHQDRLGKGWAVSASDEAEDIRWIKRMGADAVRTSHYPQSPTFYRLCDEQGLLVWTELPLVDEVPVSEKFRRLSLQAAEEMVGQLANHPSVAMWGIFNEVYQFKRSPDGTAEPLLTELRDRIHALDPSRPVVAASNRDLDRLCAIPDGLGMNLYPGWYAGYGVEPEAMASRIARSVAASGRRCIGVSEYGGGGCIDQHGNVFERPQPNARVHPEDYQAWLHHGNYAGIAGNPSVWGSFAWVMFDLGSDSRQEGSQTGRNDKGLVTGDRKTAKDAWYFYKCNWNPEPELRIVGERETRTREATRDVVVFCNAPEVMFMLNGKLHGAQVPDKVKTCVWKGVPLKPGENMLEFRAGSITRRLVIVREGDPTPAAPEPFPTISAPRAVTQGPHDHFLANYFAINAWSADLRYLAVLETDVNGRLAEPNERCTLGLVDTQDGNRFIPVTTTACWNFQEATMFHWLPNEKDTFIFNDVRDGKFVAVVMNWKTKRERVVPHPVSAVSRDGRWALSLNYARLYLTRPDYGYAGNGQDAREKITWPEDDGLWLVNLQTGEAKLVLSVAQGRSLMPAPKEVPGKPGNPLAYYCHTVFNPSATRVFFLARTVDWYNRETHKIPNWLTTSFTVKTDGTDLRRCFADDTAGGSHFHWLDDRTMAVTIWPTGRAGKRYSRHMKFTVGEEEKAYPMAPGLLDWDGHCVWSPNGKWMSTEGYYDADFNRQWALMRTADEAVKSIGSFFVPEKYRPTYWRCDLHARWRPDGKQLAFNSVHEGSRQVYVRDVRED